MEIDIQYIYLLQEREFIKTNEKIYKIGKTKQKNNDRFKQYPKGSILLFQLICPDCDTLEKELITIFKNKYKHRKDIGNEYFEGDSNNMIQIIYQTIMIFDSKNKNTNNLSSGWHKDIAGPQSKYPGREFWWNDDGRRTWDNPEKNVKLVDKKTLPEGWHKDIASSNSKNPGKIYYWNDDGKRQWEFPN